MNAADILRAICSGFGRCPKSRRVVFAVRDDNKAWCGHCGEAHLLSRLEAATVDDYLSQKEERHEQR